jgi:hypothetical protein
MGLLAVFLSVLALLALLLAWPAWRRAAEDPRYAAEVFDGLVPYDRVFASRRWNPPWANGWGCTYALVALNEAGPGTPGQRETSVAGWEDAWGGEWLPTPAARLGDATRDAMDACASHFDPDTAARLKAALATSGSWYVRDRVGETVHLYALKHGIVARVRYGD